MINSHLVLVSPEADGTEYVLRSKYVSGFNLFNSYKDAVQYLIDSFPVHQGSVIICTSDGASSEMDLHYSVLSRYYAVPNARNDGVITEHMNKEVMAGIAERTGIRVPKTWTFDKDSKISSDIEYPCIVKPLLSIEGSKSDIRVCYTPSELGEYIATKNQCKRVQIQKYIQRDYEYQLIGCSLDGGNEVIIPGVSKVLRPSECSNTGYLIYEPLDESYPIKECSGFLREVGYSGLFSMEFIRDDRGDDFFMEINFRNDGNAICVLAAGVNLPYIWYLHCIGEDLSNVDKTIKRSVFVMPEFDDFIMVLKRKVGLFKWLADIKKTDCFMEYDSEDKAPFYLRLKQFCTFLVKRMLRIR